MGYSRFTRLPTIWEGFRGSTIPSLSPLWMTIAYYRRRKVKWPGEVGVLSAHRARGVSSLHPSGKDASTPFLKKKKLGMMKLRAI